jgi:hypothetical protein
VCISAGGDDQSTFRAELNVADGSTFVAHYFAARIPRPSPPSRVISHNSAHFSVTNNLPDWGPAARINEAHEAQAEPRNSTALPSSSVPPLNKVGVGAATEQEQCNHAAWSAVK